MKVALQTLLVDRELQEFYMNIPVTPSGISYIRQLDSGHQPYMKTDNLSGCPFISISTKGVSEYFVPSDKTNITIPLVRTFIPVDRVDSWYVRSGVQELESAGTAAVLIHTDPEKAFRAAYKSVESFVPSFYTGEIRKIIDVIGAFNKLLELEGKKKDDFIQKLVTMSDEEFADLFSLTFHN